MTDSLPSHWGPDWNYYAIQTAPQAEFQAASYLTDPILLAEQGLDEDDLHVLLPLRHTLNRPVARRATDRRTRRSLVARPRLPGYLFLGVQPAVRLAWAWVLSLPGILGFLGSGGEPRPVEDRQLVIAMLNDLRRVTAKPRRTKSPVEIRNGPYAGRLVAVAEIMAGDPEIYPVDPASKSRHL